MMTKSILVLLLGISVLGYRKPQKDESIEYTEDGWESIVNKIFIYVKEFINRQII